MELEVAENYLESIGCCWRCILIFLGHSNVEKFVDNGKFTSVSLSEDKKTENTEFEESKTNENGIESLLPESKKLKISICISCLGVLQSCDSSTTIQNICDAVKNDDYEAKRFSLGISLPICLPFRIHTIWAHLLKKFPSFNTEPARTNHVGVMKDIWRSIAGPKIGSEVKKIYVAGQLDSFCLQVQAEYTNDAAECLPLEKLDQAKFLLRRKQCKKYAEGLYTNQVVREMLNDANDERLLHILPFLPLMPNEPVTYKCQCSHKSLFLAGRYNKFSRTLPQTPWFVSEDRRFDSSVQELICDPINLFIKANGIKFSSSGREDVDVRCLGRGRPFVIEFTNPRKVEIGEEDLTMLQDRVNTLSCDVSIKDLQVICKKDTSNLKEGELEKTKSYCALCFSSEIVSSKSLDDLESIKDLTLDQMTPVRVLHRRPLSVRKRVVHSIKAERIDDHFFKLYVNTQAGTYIKEFVHGDFGRTTPNLGSILGAKCDILALDVENVFLDWPPPKNIKTNLI